GWNVQRRGLYREGVLPGSRPDADEPHQEILERSPGWWATPLLNRVPRWLLLVAATALLAGGGAVLITSQGGHGPAGQAGRPSLGPIRVVPFIPTACGHFTGDRTSPGVPNGYRVILGAVAVPPVYVGPMQPNGNGPWRYWRKVVFGVRGGSPPVTLSIPATQQRNAAIDLEVGGIGSIFHLPGCPPSHLWNATVGGFYLKAPTACLQVQVQVGRQDATVLFGLGHPCPATGQPVRAQPMAAAQG
ncbi:MAG TPA: hypothetical protein VGI74_08050, partial [Streptosporangiaceae bacterium]